MFHLKWLLLEAGDCPRTVDSVDCIGDLSAIHLHSHEGVNGIFGVYMSLLARDRFQNLYLESLTSFKCWWVVFEREMDARFHRSVERLDAVGRKEDDSAEVLQFFQKDYKDCELAIHFTVWTL